MPLSTPDKDSKYRAFGYDPKYQLKAETFWSAKVPGARSDTYLWTYDGNGNRLTEHVDGARTLYSYGSNNEMTEAGVQDFTYDHFGNTASIVSQQTFTYNFDNCMTQLSYAASENIDTHEYDGNMRRMRSKLNSATNWTNFIHDELTENLICEYTLVSGTYSIKALNTYGLGLISSNREGTIRYFHFDGLGSTYHLTDTSENITDSYTYNAFGVPLSASGSSINPYRYVGQWGYYDDGARGSNSGMLLLGVRYYWPMYGRFATWDPVPQVEAYLYASNSVLQAVDAGGLQQAIDPIREYFKDVEIPFPFLPSKCERAAPWPPGSSSLQLFPPSFAYGNCCGLSQQCHKYSKTFSCTDAACRDHDDCVGPLSFGVVTNWLPCNRRFCNDIKYCWNQHCTRAPFDFRQCKAIAEIANGFCNSFGGGPPLLSQPWR